jgi:predicted cupin superfamily sugar epimerase/RimJ/RimL family protein N-acetyltransferase
MSVRPSTVSVRPVASGDAPAWKRMRAALWPDEDAQELAAEADQFIAGLVREPVAVLLAFDDGGTALGFAELSIRSHAEDCETDRVAYLEGWFVVEAARRRGVGGALVRAAEEWARAQGCSEFGSDALIDNEISARAHRALGFEQTCELRTFRKALSETPDARVSALIRDLGLQPHPEGGYFAEVFRSDARVATTDGRGERRALTTIYYLLAAGQVSRWHRVRSDEVWHFYEGAPLELLVVSSGAASFTPHSLTRHRLGPVLEQARPTYTVRAGDWQAARTTGAYTLVGCTVGPGFDFADFTMARDADGLPPLTW